MTETPAGTPRRTPLVIAHRGASSELPEHTLPAYLAALEAGADGLECDVRLTRDGHLVCVHDRTVNRTSDATGVVSELELAALTAMNFGAHRKPGGGDPHSGYYDGVAPDQVAAGNSRVLTLETLLEVMRDTGGQTKLLIETKHPTRYAGLVEKELVRLLRRFGWATTDRRADGQVMVMSFSTIALRRVRLLAPELPLVVLVERLAPHRRDGSLPTGVQAVGASLGLLRADPRFVGRAQERGHQVLCWTVDEPADICWVAELGVDSIITNRPGLARASLAGS